MTDTAPTLSLAGKVAVVTGGGRGIGLSIAQELLAHGARVMIVGRSEERLEAASQELGNGAFWCAADVSSPQDVARLASEAQRCFDQIDIVVNNAGVNPFYKATEVTTDLEWNQIIDVNLTGTFLCIREFVGPMLARAAGAFVNITSIAGASGLSRTAAYCASKAGVEAMSRSMAVDWAKKGVRVNCIAPGYVETDLTSGIQANAKLGDAIRNRTPIGRFGKSEEIANAAVFLCSDAASYITGTTLYVDGGWNAT